MNSIPSISLEDTLHLLQLARETAVLKGRPAQADALKPLTDKMQSLVSGAEGKTVPPAEQKVEAPLGMLGQSDFRTLLEVVKSSPEPAPANRPAGADTNRMVVAMSSASMPEVEIARQLGITREEVQLVLRVHASGF